MKRNSCNVSTAASKKAKKSTDPTSASIEIVAKALRAAEHLPTNVADLLCATLTDMLLPHREERHEYQHKMVELVAGELANIEARMQASIEEGQEAMKQAEEDKLARANDVLGFDAVLQTARQVYATTKTRLADITVAFNVAKAAFEDAKKEEETGRIEVEVAGVRKVTVQDLLSRLDDLHTEPDKIDGVIKQIVKNVDVESAMLAAVPSALRKDAESRQVFDQMVMTTLREKMTARIDELSRTVEESGPRMQSLCQACSTAMTALDAARRRLVDAAKEFTTTQEAQSKAEASMKSAQKTSRSAATKVSASKRALEAAQAQLDLFKDGAMASFNNLRLRERSPIVLFDDDEKISVADSPTPNDVSVAGTPMNKSVETAEAPLPLESFALAGA